MRRYRPLIVLLLSVGIPALVGGTFGRRALALDDKIADQQKTFVAALRAIETNYVDEVPSDRLVYSAIRGMLGTLDPHSSFFDPKEYAQMRERQEGRYYGLGITIAAIDGDIVAQSVFEGSPAYKMGVRRGDIIARIAGEDAKGWSTEQAMVKLRGPKGTNVQIEIKRRGYEQPIPLEVTRDEVHILTVPVVLHGRCDHGLHPHEGLRREHRSRGQGGAARSHEAGHEAAALRCAPEPGRPARSGDQSGEQLPAQGQDDRLHARADRELRSGLPRGRRRRVPEHPDRHAGEPQQRERLGDCHRRAPGSRSRLHRRRDDVRQGARPVGLPNRQRRRAGAHDGALLHAVAVA